MRNLMILVTLFGFLPITGEAKVGTLSDAPTIRKPNLMRQKRFEISPAIGIMMNSEYTREVLVQFGALYHVTDYLGIGLEFSYGAPLKTSLTSGIETEYSKDPEWATSHPGEKYSVSRSSLEIMAGPVVTFVPLKGKILLFRRYLSQVDLHLTLGGGFARVKGIGRMDTKNTYNIMVGGGLRFFVWKGLSVNLEVKDYMVQRILVQPPGGGAKSKFTQNPCGLLGVSIFFPQNVERGH